MPFRVAQETLEALEWPALVALLRACCATPQARRRLERHPPDDAPAPRQTAPDTNPDEAPSAPCCASWLFEESTQGVRERLAETSEARALLDAEDPPPLGGAADIEETLRRAEQGALLEPPQLGDVRSTLQTLRALARFLLAREDTAPRLADLARTMAETDELTREIDRCIDASFELRDDASPQLAAARREVQGLGHTLQQRIERCLRAPEIARHLSDSYFTLRNDRYVLPVRADARGRVRGIVHDASRSGTTLFIEPESVVELNNRLRQSELTVQREIERVLRRLSQAVAAEAEPLRADLETLMALDLAFARGRLSQHMEAVEPEVGDEGILDLPGLRHPLIPTAQCVPNDVELGREFRVLILSGPNAGGKTVAMKALALASLCVRAGLHVACAKGARVDLCECLAADIGDNQDIAENLSTFSAHMAKLARVAQAAGPGWLVALDEIGVGTDPGEGAALAQSVLERLAERGARVITTTHYNLLKEMAAVDPRFRNACVEFDAETLAPTYRLRLGIPGASSAASVAARMGMPSDVLERADALLLREDRQLERTLAELASSRAALTNERARLEQLRNESESARDAYRQKLERLQERRDELFRAMRGDLDRAFKEAHQEVAGVIRELQRGPSAQQAAAARARLLEVEARAEEAEERAGVRHEASAPDPEWRPIDWRHIEPGASVRVAGGGSGVLLALPDRRGRVAVQLGGARLLAPAESVGHVGGRNVLAASGSPRQPAGAAPGWRAVTPPGRLGGTLECDLRGERVDDALERLGKALDCALAEGRDALRVIHGHGTGALRRAVRDYLAAAPRVEATRAGERNEGGNGVTLAEFE